MLRGGPPEEERMDLLEQHARAMAEFDRRVERIPDDGWDAPTACTAWDVRTLVNHLVAEQRWVPHLLAGETLEQVGDRYDGDLLGDDPLGVWRAASREAREAMTGAGALEGSVHTSMGALPTDEYVRQMTLDLAIHAWDLTAELDLDDDLDPDLVEELYRTWEPQAELLGQSGVFDPVVPVPDDAPLQTKLLGILGRDRR
jgi:uncharacterized protein (TIGR03086 family)